MKKRMSLWGSVLACALAVVIGLCLCSAPAGAATRTVTEPGDWDDGTCDADCTLREAINHANSGDTVNFNENDTYVLSLGEIVIDKDLTIEGRDGATHGNTIISGNNASRVFRITAGWTTIKNLTITNGQPSAEEPGGGIANYQDLTLENVVVSNCTATNASGGGIYNYGWVYLKDCLITGNTAQGDAVTYTINGGGIYCKNEPPVQAELIMEGTVVSLNQAVELGGGLSAITSDLDITGCTFDQNQSSTGSGYYGGGGMYAHDSEVDVIDCQFNQNTAAWGGGGIAAEHHSALSIDGSTFYRNSTGFGGGGIFFSQGIFKATNSTFSDNLADYSGGGLALRDLDGTIGVNLLSFVTITNNTADADCDGGGTCDDGAGGGLYFENPGLLELKGVIVAGNSDRSVTLKFADIYHASGTLQSNGYNLIGDNTSAGTAFPAGLPNGNNDYVGTSASPLTGVVQGITDNGGLTWTCALPAGSLAINHGPPDCADGGGSAVTTDQRGLGRNRGGCPDIGAYETPAGGTPMGMLLE